MFSPGIEENHVKFQASSLALCGAEALHWSNLHIHLQKSRLAQLWTTDQLLRFVSRGTPELRIGGRHPALQGILSIADGIEPQDSSWVASPCALELWQAKQKWAPGKVLPRAHPVLQLGALHLPGSSARRGNEQRCWTEQRELPCRQLGALRSATPLPRPALRLPCLRRSDTSPTGS